MSSDSLSLQTEGFQLIESWKGLGTVTRGLEDLQEIEDGYDELVSFRASQIRFLDEATCERSLLNSPFLSMMIFLAGMPMVDRLFDL